MKILFVKPPVNRGKKVFGPLVSEVPLGLMYLSSFLKAQGYSEIKIIHMDAEGMTFDELENVIKEYNPELIGISAMTAESLGMHQVAAIAKKNCPASLVIVGGPYPTAYTEDSLSNENIDIVVRGEGEETLLEIIKTYECGKTFDAIKSICFRCNGHIVETERRNYIDDLDKLPYPDWDAIQLEKYKNLLPQSFYLYRQDYMSLFTSRGCPFQCTYCHNIFGKKFRAHSPQRVLDEIEILHDKFGISNFEILDDIFNFDKQRAVTIMKGIIASSLKIRLFLANGVRGDMLDEELIDLFAEAGVVFMSVAVETASPRLQKEIRRYSSLNKLKKLILYASQKKIFVNGFFMLGFPTETIHEIVSTIKFAVNSKLHTASFFLVHPFEGTPIADVAHKLGRQTISARNKSNYYYLVSSDSVNCSRFSNTQLKTIFSLANILFYFNPLRIIRIIKNLPNKKVLKTLIIHFFARIFQLV